MRSPKLNAPGHKIRQNRDGSTRLLWIARADIVRLGYEPKSVRLHYDARNATQWPLIEAACHKLESEMLAWAAGQRSGGRPFDGTLDGLVHCYQTDPASPYADLKWNTRRTYDQVLAVISKAFGKRALGTLRIGDFRRWYDEAKKPKAPGGPERVRKSHGIIQMLRRLFAYGVMAELSQCARLASILDEARFKQPRRRRQRLELGHVKVFIAKALEAEPARFSLALGTAIQFETGMRQRDVIGEWEPIEEGEDQSGIALRGRRWVNGLTWADLANDSCDPQGNDEDRRDRLARPEALPAGG